MFEEGDIVMICASDKAREEATADSPLLNLEGTICKIKEATQKSNGVVHYQLEVVELVAKKPELFEEYMCWLAWTDEHLVLAKRDVEIKKDEILTLFSA